ncbi:MAG: LptF/LptG family permease [Myxococcota bacterium]|jgi:lipopolysaccharide export LptBFGC system permease protein LptF|nr:LptF/LptG family permease [Myxococcota bacterium]
MQQLGRTTALHAWPLLLAKRCTLRALVLAFALALLVFVSQLVRIAAALPGGRFPSLSLVAASFVWTLPSILALSIPMAWLISFAMTLGSAVQEGEWLAWQCLGRDVWQMLSPSLASLALLLAVQLNLLCWLGPSALGRAGALVETAWLDALTARSVERGVRLEQLAIRAAARPSSQRLQDVHATWQGPNGDVEIAARSLRVETALDGGSTRALFIVGEDLVATQQSAELSAQRAPAVLTSLQAARMELTLKLPASALLPSIESASLIELVSRWEQPLARGQVFKRLTLVLFPLVAVLALLHTVLWRSAWAAPHRAASLALLLCGAEHLLARSVELLARRSAVSASLLLATMLAFLAVLSSLRPGWGARLLSRFVATS